tara:strand:+ start:205 stop:582 length:378 start_codon:yes stop_codon:yes gene_type:complete
MIYSIGRVCKKLAGREAGRVCVVISKPDKQLVLIDGDVRRRNCNQGHLEPMTTTLELKENATTKDVVSALQNAGFDVTEKKKTEKKTVGEKPTKQRKTKETKKVKKEAEEKEAKPKKEKKKAKKK